MAAETIGFVGIGRMGGPMAGRLMDAGYSLCIYDPNSDATTALVERGARLAKSPAEVASSADIVLASLPTPDIVKAVALGPDGIVAGNRASIMIDLSTTLGRILSPTRPSLARARDGLLRAAALAPAVKRWTLEMRFKPVPHYRTGFVVPEPAGTRVPSVGRMLAQPVVETADGAQHRLDDVLGPWFAVVGFECDPLSGLTDAELAAVRLLRPRVVKVVESRAGTRHHGQPCVAEDTVVVEDVHNEFRAWFQARGRNALLVRPDRYVATMSAVDAFGPLLTQLARRYTGRPR